MLHIVMDSAGDLPSDWLDRYKIHIVPVNIHFGEKTYLDGIDIDRADFYKWVQETKIIPKTSQPSPHQFIQHYRRIATDGETILSIHVTGKLSGTLASAQAAARELAGQINIIPFDSASGSAAMGFMCREAREIEKSGGGVEQVIEHLRSVRKNISIVLTLDTLEFARMSGRVRALQAAIASLLNIKPIIVLQEGALNMGEMVRTRKKSLNRLLEIVKEKVGDQVVNMAVVHAEDLPTAQELLLRVQNQFNCNHLLLTELSISIAANLGPGTVGVVAYPLKEV